MCGIVGYTGRRQCVPLLVSGLQRLEYRGYDSAGVAVVGLDHTFDVRKAVGKLSNLTTDLERDPPLGSTGIGHTRWATHGVPSDLNAHPHTDCTGRVCVVHNGVVENYAELRASLKMAGHQFTSETDTEVLAHLIESELEPLPPDSGDGTRLLEA